MWQELRGLNSADGVIDQLAEFVTLFFGDRGSQVLNFNQPLTDENNLGDFRDTGDPRVADKLRIESQQTGWFFWVAIGRSLPLQEAATAIELADGIDIGHEVIAAAKRLNHFDL